MNDIIKGRQELMNALNLLVHYLQEGLNKASWVSNSVGRKAQQKHASTYVCVSECTDGRWVARWPDGWMDV